VKPQVTSIAPAVQPIPRGAGAAVTRVVTPATAVAARPGAGARQGYRAARQIPTTGAAAVGRGTRACDRASIGRGGA